MDHDRKALRNYALGDIWNWYPSGEIYTTEVQIGVYRHFKGGLYQVICLGHDSESNEEIVVYRNLYGSFGAWVRSRKMFTQVVDAEGKSVPRFMYLGPVG